MKAKIGEVLRGIRLSKGEILKDMADKLEVSSAFLSAIENGKKKMPDRLVERIRILYNLSEADMEEMKDAILESNDKVEIDLQESSESGKELALTFARKFGSMDEQTQKHLLRIINKKVR